MLINVIAACVLITVRGKRTSALKRRRTRVVAKALARTARIREARTKAAKVARIKAAKAGVSEMHLTVTLSSLILDARRIQQQVNAREMERLTLS